VSEARLLEVHGLSKHYPVRLGPVQRGTVHALSDADFTLGRAETLAVVGESGSGKSTLARQLAGLERPSSGRILLDGDDVTHPRPAARRLLHRRIRMVFQDPFASLNPRARIGALLAEPLRGAGMNDAGERQKAVEAMLEKVGLEPDSARRFPHMFSGGQRQRIAIARALIPRPDVVVADEPVSALDVSVQAQVLNLMADLQDELGASYILIAHDLSVVRHMADRVLVLYLGRMMEYGPAQQVLGVPRHPYTRALMASIPRISARRGPAPAPLRGELPSPLRPPTGCVFRTRCPHARSECAAARPELRELDGRSVACHYAEEITAEAGVQL
jgi:dipeptide transport system ATP-binding protein